MIVTIFKNISNTSAPFHVNIDTIFERIISGKSKELITKIRAEHDKQERNKLKKNLPSILFSGKFETRHDTAIKEHSGLICLDFDGFKSDIELNATRQQLIGDTYTFALFTSPSGDGLKLLVKIPPEIQNHKAYFKALSEYYNNVHFDNSCSNISRVCYESYDNNIYINKNSKLFDNINTDESYFYYEKTPTVPITDTNEIISRLQKWHDKNFTMVSGQRNHNLFVLASAFNEYGVSKNDAITHCMQYVSTDFTHREIENTVLSAYRKTQIFGTKYFEDRIKQDRIKVSIKNGSTKNQIITDYKIDEETFNEISKEVKESDGITQFWDKTDKGKIIINNRLFKQFLENKGFKKLYPEQSDTYIFVRIQSNIIEETTTEKIKSFVLDYVYNLTDHSVYEHLAKTTSLFKDEYLNFLEPANVVFKRDDKDTAYLYFNNGVLSVMSDKLDLTNYIDVDGYVWKKQVINANYVSNNYTGCVFDRFIKNVSANDNKRELAIKTAIGYLCHSYQKKSNNKAIIQNDEMISDNPEGGTGKGIITNAIGYIKRLAIIDGKTFSFDKSFAYQLVSADTQILVFDDAQKNFDFEKLFSVITEGITIEKKNKDAIKIPIERSPKILINTNYTITGSGNSHERRKWNIELSQHYNKNNTPEKEFMHILFDDWDEDEWLKFYNYMINCIQLYLQHGLTSVEYVNLYKREFISKTSQEFFDWSFENLNEKHTRYYNIDVFNKFIEDYPDYKKWLTNKKFMLWVNHYVNYIGLNIVKSKTSNGDRYFELIKDNNKTNEDTETFDDNVPF